MDTHKQIDASHCFDLDLCKLYLCFSPFSSHMVWSRRYSPSFLCVYFQCACSCVCYLRPLPSRPGSPLDFLNRFSSGVLIRPKHKHWSDVADQSWDDDSEEKDARTREKTKKLVHLQSFSTRGKANKAGALVKC